MPGSAGARPLVGLHRHCWTKAAASENLSIRMFDRIDAFTRPAAIGIALFVALVLHSSARTDLRARLAALSAAGTAAYLVCSTSPGFSVAMVPIVPLCIGNSVFFWWFVRSLFEDE